MSTPSPPKKTAPTIRQIAKACRVSPMTVSFVLNNKPGQVSEETRERVLRVMREMGYRPRASTRVPSESGTHAIGVATGRHLDPLSPGGYFATIFNGILNATERLGYSILLFHNSLFRDDPHKSIRTYFDGRCDGLLLLAPSPGMPLVAALAERGVPFALIGDQGDSPNVASVDVDNVAEAEKVVDYLVGLGHRRIAFVGGAERYARGAVNRRIGYERAMARHGLSYPPEYCLAPMLDDTEVYQATVSLLRRKEIPTPTALFGWNDGTAVRAMMAAQDCRLRIPEEISVIGYDDDPRAAAVYPPLTTVRQPYMQIAASAVEMLIARVRDNDYPPEALYLPTRLIERDSTAPPASSPPSG